MRERLTPSKLAMLVAFCLKQAPSKSTKFFPRSTGKNTLLRI